MILLPKSVKIFVGTAPVDLHRSFEGLSNEVRCVLAEDPLSGHVFLFLNRRRSQVKMLLWTRGGFLIVHNQPSSHCTSFRSALRALFFARGYSHCGGSIRKPIPSAAVLRGPS